MDFLNKVEDYIKKGAKVSKEAFDKAGDKIQDFSDQSVIKVEIHKLENCEKDLSKKLGELAVKTFVDEGKEALESANEEVASIVAQIKEVRGKIADQKKELEKFQK